MKNLCFIRLFLVWIAILGYAIWPGQNWMINTDEKFICGAGKILTHTFVVCSYWQFVVTNPISLMWNTSDNGPQNVQIHNGSKFLVVVFNIRRKGFSRWPAKATGHGPNVWFTVNGCVRRWHTMDAQHILYSIRFVRSCSAQVQAYLDVVATMQINNKLYPPATNPGSGKNILQIHNILSSTNEHFLSANLTTNSHWGSSSHVWTWNVVETTMQQNQWSLFFIIYIHNIYS